MLPSDITEYSPVSRRHVLQNAFNGVGTLALGHLLSTVVQAETQSPFLSPLSERPAHHRRKAKHCIFLFMQGGVSQVDSFEYKPELQRLHGKPLPETPDISGELQGRLSFPHVCVGSPFRFSQQGETGRYFSNLIPHLARHADELAFIHGVKTDNQNHGPSTLHVTTGSQFHGSPSVGSWVSYGLGTTNQNMPGYVVIQDPRGAPVNGAAVWGNGYLPASYQGTLLRSKGTPILNLDRSDNLSRQQQRQELDTLRWLNRKHRNQRQENLELEARIQAYELAFRMQIAAPELMNLSGESDHTRRLYGLEDPETANFGHQCLLARRLVESGVRYSLLVHGVQINQHSWDDHGNVKDGMIKHSREVDAPIAGLLTDLKQRGMLDETLVIWASEMGRTPFKNGTLGDKPGREHNSYGLVMWMAGGDVRAGATIGQTDPFGLRSTDEPIPIRNVHATILHLLGLDDQRLRYLHAGRLRQLTDIGGSVIENLVS